MRIQKHFLLAGAFAMLQFSQPTPAALVIDVVETGGNTVATASGSVKIGGLTALNIDSLAGFTAITGSNRFPSGSSGLTVGTTPAQTDRYQIIDSASATFATGATQEKTFFYTGDVFNIGIDPGNSRTTITVPTGYSSGSSISGSATWVGKGFEYLGLQPGTYTYEYKSASGSDTVTVNIIMPDDEAPTWPNAPLNIVEVDVLQAGLTWSAAEDDGSGLKEYIVYRDELEVARVNELSYLDTVFASGTYHYRIEAVDNAGNVSTDGPTESIKLDAPVQGVVSVPSGARTDYNGDISHREWRVGLKSFQLKSTRNDGSNFGWLWLPFGHVIFRHNEQRLELLLNITSDTVDDALIDGGSDQFWLLFDVDHDGIITEGVDRRYLLEPGTGNLRSQIFAEPGASEQFNPMRETMSARAEGFGCFVEDETLYEDKDSVQGTVCRRHRVWEVGIDLREIGIDDNDPVAHMGIQIISGEPAIQYALPASVFNLASYTELRLLDIRPGDLTPETRPAQATMMLTASQGIEDKTGNEDIPFIAGRRTAVRANNMTSDASEPWARVAVFAGSNGIDAPGSPFIDRQRSIFVDNEGVFDIEDEDRSGWFILPEFASAVGTLEVRAGLYIDGVIPQDQKSITMLPDRELEYWVYGISGGPGSSTAPSESSIHQGIKDNLGYLPTSSLSWVYKGELTTSVNNGPALNKQLQGIYDLMSMSWAMNSGAESFIKPDMIVGFTKFKLCRKDPASDDGCGAEESGKSYPTWRKDTGRVFWANVDGTTFAHEINHNADRTSEGTWGRHIPKFSGCGASGDNTDPQWPYPSTNIQAWAHLISRSSVTAFGSGRDDLMAYCTFRWSSPYRWRSLFYNYFAAPEVVPPANLVTTAQSGSISQPITKAIIEAEINEVVDTIYVNGSLNADGSGELGALLLQPGVPEPPLGTGDYALVQLGCGGEILDSQSFAAFFEGVEGGALDSDAFRFTLPMHPDLCAMELTHNGEVLAEITQSLTPPVVEILQPAGGDVWDGVQTITWQGSDVDDDVLSYSLFYSHDDGTSWTVLTGDLDATEYEVNTDGWIGGEAGRIRVIASDGFNNSITDSPESFTVLANPPRALVSFPAAGDYMPSGEVVELTGIGWEVGGERLKGDALRWYLDDKFIGVGESIGVNLPTGQFTLRLDVINPGGLTGSDSTGIHPGILFGSGFE